MFDSIWSQLMKENPVFALKYVKLEKVCRPASVINTCFHSDKIRRRDFWPQFHKTEGFPRLATTQEDVKLARFLSDFERHGEVYLASVKAVPVNAFLSTHGLETNSENSATVTVADSRLFLTISTTETKGFVWNRAALRAKTTLFHVPLFDGIGDLRLHWCWLKLPDLGHKHYSASGQMYQLSKGSCLNRCLSSAQVVEGEVIAENIQKTKWRPQPLLRWGNSLKRTWLRICPKASSIKSFGSYWVPRMPVSNLPTEFLWLGLE